MMQEATIGADRPSTYFWQDAALLAMQAISHRVDDDRGGQPYFWLNLKADPPRLEHQSWDYCDMSGRWVDGLLLGRLMTGAQDYAAVEQTLRTFLLARANPRDGLFYNADAPEFGSRGGADLFCQGRVLLGLLSWWLECGESRIENYIRRLIGGLAQAALWDEDCAYYPATLRGEGSWLNVPHDAGALDPKVAPALGAPGYWASIINGVMAYHRYSGSLEALHLAGGLARYYMHPGGAVAADGSYRGHTHSGGVLPTTAGILRFGLATHDEGMVRWAQRVFEYTRRNAADFGWLPDGVGFPDDYMWSQFCETCALSDYLELAILLSEAGLGDYWDDVERCARNQLLENQFRAMETVLPPGTDARVIAAANGGFACGARPNTPLGWEDGLEGCCLGSGLHALYLIWNHALLERAGTVFINLPISRSSHTLEVVSYEPYRGELRLLVRQACAVDVRLSRTVAATSTQVTLNGRPIQDAVSGGHCRLPGLQAGDVALLRYPLAERREAYTLAGRRYTASWRGQTVTRLEPADDRCPSYQRADLEGQPPVASRLFAPSASQLPW
ncbi:MAG TPA: hypothetical protein VFE42_24510 [Chloroflexota bacterium]|nr:hypothetical protein [Chloroflexota bacterium]